jgi:hypothetical protein
LEVQGRPVVAPGALSAALGAVWARRWSAVALALAVAASAVVVAAQPVGSPWWTYADADASYAASSLNVLLGRDLRFVDHPGLPLTEIGAVAFGVDALVHGHGLDGGGRLDYVRASMLDLDRARPVFRGLAVAFFLAGGLLAFLLVSRLLGHWTWGLAAGLLWVASPGLVPMSIQFRPDVLLAVLCLVFAYLVGRAVAERSPGHYAGAAVVAGVAVMVKLHAAGLIAPLALAALWRPPTGASWPRLRAATAERVRRRPLPFAVAGAVWLLLAVLLNWEQLPFSPTRAQLSALGGLLLVVAALAVLARLAPRPVARVLSPFSAFVAAAFAAGLLLPVTLQVPGGLQALVNVAKSGSGSGVQEEVDSFGTPFTKIVDLLPGSTLLVLVLAGAAGVVGLLRRDPRPVVWAAGALTLGVLAFARPPAVHYFAPAFALSVPAALWLLQRERGAATSVLVWPIVLLVAWPAFRDRDAPAVETERFAAHFEPARRAAEARLQPGEVALVPSYWPFEDSRYFELVTPYADYSPERRYRFLPTTLASASYASQHGLRPRYAIGHFEGPVRLGELGEYTARRVPRTALLVELVAGPGIDRPWVER